MGSVQIEDGDGSNQPRQDATHSGLADLFSQSQGWGQPWAGRLNPFRIESR